MYPSSRQPQTAKVATIGHTGFAKATPSACNATLKLDEPTGAITQHRDHVAVLHVWGNCFSLPTKLTFVASFWHVLRTAARGKLSALTEGHASELQSMLNTCRKSDL